MNRAWTQLGGARSPLGLSLHRQIKVEGSAHDPFEHCAVFRGGVLTLSDDGRHATANAIEEVDLSCVGVEWLGPVERRRPLAGVIAAFGPASGSVDVRSLSGAGGAGRRRARRRGSRRSTCRSCAAGACRTTGSGSRWSTATAAERPDAAAIDGVAERLRARDRGGGGRGQRRAGRGAGAAAVVQAERGRGGRPVAGAPAQSRGRTACACPRRSACACTGARWARVRRRRARGARATATSTIAGWTHRIAVSEGGAAHGAGEDRCALFFRAQTRIEPRAIEVEIPGPGTFRESRPIGE